MIGIVKHYLADNIKQEYSKFEQAARLTWHVFFKPARKYYLARKDHESKSFFRRNYKKKRVFTSTSQSLSVYYSQG